MLPFASAAGPLERRWPRLVNRFVQTYGLRPVPSLYEACTPMPGQAACEMEVKLAIALREAGCGVWQD